MAKIYPVLRMSKLKSASGVRHFVDETCRKDPEKNCKRADPTRLSDDTFSASADEVYADYLKKLPASNRKNAVYGLSFVVGASADFDKFDEFFADARNWLDKKFNSDNRCGWAIHRDEATPHMQLVYIPLLSGKLNAKHFVGGSKHVMEQFQTDFYEQVGKKYGMAKPVSKSQTKKVHQSAEQWEREKAGLIDLLDTQKKAVETHETAVSLRESAVVEKEQALAKREKNLAESEKVIQFQTKILNVVKADVAKNFPPIPNGFTVERENKLTVGMWDWLVKKYETVKGALVVALFNREIKKQEAQKKVHGLDFSDGSQRSGRSR